MQPKIKDIEIKNLRGYEHFNLKELKQINLFVGNNNSGKSTILEAIFLLMGMGNPDIPIRLNRFRGLGNVTSDSLKYFFNKLEIRNRPNIFCKFNDKSERQLELKPLFKSDTNSLQTESFNENFIKNSTSDNPELQGLDFTFYERKSQQRKTEYHCYLSINPLELKINNDYKEEFSAIYISSTVNDVNSLVRFSELVKKKKGQIILEALQKIDPKIEQIQALPDGLYFSYQGIDEMIPSNISGDGVRKFLSIISSIANKNGGFVLIDEVENGLHYTAHKSLWRSIITIASEFDVQLFITSHSMETIKYLEEVLEEEEYASYQEKFGLFKVAHTKKAGIKAYQYSFGGVKSAIETNTEIR
ncbi:AAA family ATPase [Flammeovirga sp. MY04]|uniref:AAA family ATPase n=1 Tax=Flammeovirga sp. MY04 TaxID=1191459 RepID=UPI00080641C6|nr:ATP-binding protein [Flammeovirga sp. MY04]ANQ51493.1 AAA family ATPase [Flammeovirga sp. MY04]